MSYIGIVTTNEGQYLSRKTKERSPRFPLRELAAQWGASGAQIHRIVGTPADYYIVESDLPAETNENGEYMRKEGD